MKDIDSILFSTYHYKTHFLPHYLYYQTIDRVFFKTLQKSIFVNCCFCSYFHGFGEEPLDPQESISEKTHHFRIHLQE